MLVISLNYVLLKVSDYFLLMKILEIGPSLPHKYQKQMVPNINNAVCGIWIVSINRTSLDLLNKLYNIWIDTSINKRYKEELSQEKRENKTD